MTMTDTEAKALALVNEIEVERYSVKRMPEIRRKAYTLDEALCRAIEREAATEARHAAEMRELKERFSEVLVAIRRKTVPQRCHDAFDELAAPFILPAPDPLVEVVNEAWGWRNPHPDVTENLRAAMQARGYEWRKIGEAGE